MSRHRKHSTKVYMRAFSIWQNLGFLPWKKPAAPKIRKKNNSGDFYKGAFDNVPFLNNDAKRTFVHLLLRPGYVIRDYICGQRERYLAPLTSLIVFYAFFALVSSVLQPVQHQSNFDFIDITEDPVLSAGIEDMEISSEKGKKTLSIFMNASKLARRGYLLLHLDQHPEAVHTQLESSLAALEGTLRSQGIPLFIGQFIFLWLAMSTALRRYRMSMSATAVASAYVLCQFSFFMLFAVLLTWGQNASISGLLMAVLLLVDYRQWLGISWKKSIRATISTGLFFALYFLLMLVAVALLVILLASPGS